jgi:hypothetical protein
MNNAMIDKNNQLLERDNKQDTGEEKSKVSTAEDPSRSSYRPMPNMLKNQNTEVSHNPKRMENSTPPAIGSAQPGKPSFAR